MAMCMKYFLSVYPFCFMEVVWYCWQLQAFHAFFYGCLQKNWIFGMCVHVCAIWWHYSFHFCEWNTICSDEGTMDLCIVYNWHNKETNVVPFLLNRALHWLGHTCQVSNWVIVVISSLITTRLPEGLDGFFP